MYSEIKIKDKKISNWINKELKRQKEHIELIASENYVSNDVLKATGLTLHGMHYFVYQFQLDWYLFVFEQV